MKTERKPSPPPLILPQTMSAVAEAAREEEFMAVDPGERNWAYAKYTKARGFFEFDVLDLKGIKGDPATKMRHLHETGLFDSATVLLLERQMKSKFKEQVTAVRAWHWHKTRLVAPHSVKRHFKTSTGKHSTNKKAHVALARSLLTTADERARFQRHKKKDDVADCICMVSWYLHTQCD